MNRLQLFLTKLIGQHRFPMTDWELKNIARNPARFYVKVDKTGMRWMREDGDTPGELSAGKSLMYFCAYEVAWFDQAVIRKLAKLRLDKFSAPGDELKNGDEEGE